MVIDYVGPALDTTILATGHMLWRLTTTPGGIVSLVDQDPGTLRDRGLSDLIVLGRITREAADRRS